MKSFYCALVPLLEIICPHHLIIIRPEIKIFKDSGRNTF